MSFVNFFHAHIVPTRRSRIWPIIGLVSLFLILYPVIDVLYYRSVYQTTRPSQKTLIRAFANLSLMATLDKNSLIYRSLFRTSYHQGKIIEVTDTTVKFIIDGSSQSFPLDNGVPVLLDVPKKRVWVYSALTSADVGKPVTIARGERLLRGKDALIISGNYDEAD